MSEDSLKKPNEKHLDFVEATITRMGHNSFHAKTWCVMIVAALLTVNFTRDEGNVPAWLILISLAIVLAFCVVDAYYLYLELGYRYLYDVVAGLEKPAKPVREYDMQRPKEAKGLKNYLRPFTSPSIYLFYGVLVALHVLLFFFYK